MRREQRATGNGRLLEQLPTIGSEVLVVRISQPSYFFGVGADDRMKGFTQKTEELLVRAPQKVETYCP